MRLPDFLESFRPRAVKLLSQVGHVEFSGGTYQVQVSDPKLGEEAWAFLQLGEHGELKDGFCSCESSEDVSRCVHLAAAYLRLFGDSLHPLHERFAHSLWNHICTRFSHKLGYETELLDKVKTDHYKIGSIFEIKAISKDGKRHLDEIITHVRDETEETSLKFSNLPQEEIERWREGRPSAELRYELSFWNDFAKWLMLLQDEGQSYAIQFDIGKEKLPERMRIRFEDVEMRFVLDREDLEAIIPSLATVDSPLPVHGMEEDAIDSMTFDKETGTLEVASCETQLKDVRGVSIGGWNFVPGSGFYAKDSKSRLLKGKIRGKELARALDRHHELIAAKLKKTKIYPDPIALSYTIDLDESYNLHIGSYLSEPGDLKEALVLGNWVYTDAFYRVQGFRFDAVDFIVPEADVDDFVTRHRVWFNNYPGFETHLATLEGQMTYAVSEEGHLSFLGDFEEDGIGSRMHDFGAWIWIERQGFYSKVRSVSGTRLRPGIAVDRNQVAPFIRKNREELKYIPGFFSESCPVSAAGLIISLTDDEHIWVQPHYELEENYENRSVRFFEDFTFVDGEGFYQLPAAKQVPEEFSDPGYLEDDRIATFVSEEIPQLEKQYRLTVDPRLFVPNKRRLTLAGAAERGRGWHSLKLAYRSDQGSVPVTDIWTAMHEKKRFLYHDAGLLDLYDKRYNWIRKIAKQNIDRRSKAVLLSTMEAIKLNVFDTLEVEAVKKSDAEEAIHFLEMLAAFEIPSPADITGLKSELRPYQVAGVDWLWFLYNQNLAGLLCDDMGLGKTHQAMALMAAVRNSKGGKGRPFLIICPTSVIYHWEDKLREHLPGFKVCTFHGSKRELESEYDVLLTSYGIWRLESRLLQKIAFEVAVLDEIQMAKNANSRLHGSLLRLDAEMRLGLTGTPIENYLQELKALFDIVLPNYMPGPTEFKEFFSKPIEKENNEERKQLLNRFINPFLLRRRKEEVLTDLPAKTEEVYHCGLMPEQEALYRDVLERSRESIMRDLGDERGSIPYIHIFAILSSLKQICDHPAVYLKRPQSYKEHRSGKWDLFVELLHEARDSNQKVVVFSQYLGMLDIIEEYLTESGIGFASIRGATANRGQQLKKFNSDPACEVFVGSLQASGLGVDLTAASVVIHYDRWWNAARENQATDRVHRIGQQRGVQVFKLVTKNTFEERIDELISSKGRLMEEVVGSDDQHIVKYLDRDEIIKLLQF